MVEFEKRELIAVAFERFGQMVLGFRIFTNDTEYRVDGWVLFVI